MPPSGRRGKPRGRRAPAVDTRDVSEAGTPEAVVTPTRSSRKRGRASEAHTHASRNTRRKTKDTRTADREDTEGTEPHDGSDAETEPAAPTEADIIQHLKVADRHVNATEDFANDLLEGQENVPGYGKIAGRDWAFIIRKVEVNIGRPEAQEKMTLEDNGPQAAPSSRTVVDIDLGPDRQVSRSHAVIAYDGNHEQWFLVVNGRNGLRVDNNLLKRGSKTYLRNGSVIEIAGTQMAFITTAGENGEGPVWDASIIKQAQKSSEEDDDGEDDARTNSNARQHGRPTSRTQLPEQGSYSGEFGGQQQQEHKQQQQHRTHPHSQRAVQGVPSTPMRSQQSFNKSSPAANYARGVMMESTESIDYAADNAKDLKPPHSYAQLIGMAILSTPEQQMTLNSIYKWIMANYAFYRFNTGGWQNSIRHNLSLNKAFTKIARRTDEPGKGMKWMIEPSEFDTFVQQGMKGCRRPQPLPATQSTLGSPTSPMHALRAGGAAGVKADEELTPPLQAYQPAYPVATEAFTPERGPKRQVDGRTVHGDNADNDSLVRATPRNNLTAIANAAGSPPALYVNEEGRTGPLDTPFPLRPSQRLAPPSTLKRPSDFIQFSSPAPFWKMEGLAGTPWKPYDLSPLKTPFADLKKTDPDDHKDGEAEDGGDTKDKSSDIDDDANVKGSPIIQSSSPPRPSSLGHALDGSPTTGRPATAVAKTLTQLAHSNDESGAGDSTARSQAPGPPHVTPPTASSASVATPPPHAPPASASHDHLPGEDGAKPTLNGYHSDGPPTHMGAYGFPGGSIPAPATAHPPNGYHPMDDADDEGIDLARGFQPIGAFHQRNHMAMTTMGVAGGAPSFGR